MKNYLVKTLFEVTNTNWQVHDRGHEQNLFDNYCKMHDVSVESFNNHLAGDWELKFIGGKVTNINEAFEKTFWYIHDLWHQEPCNILYTDPDTVAIKSVDPWNKFSNFMMFNFTDPRTFNKPNIYNKSFENFFNAGVRYFPGTMTKEVWDQGSAMAKNWDHTTYDTEQIILNTMLWDQGLTLEQACRPALAYQAHLIPWVPINQSDAWNNFPLVKSDIVHVHASRNAQLKLDLMQQLFKETTQ